MINCKFYAKILQFPPTPDCSGAKRSEHFAPNEAFGVTTKSWTHVRKKGSSK